MVILPSTYYCCWVEEPWAADPTSGAHFMGSIQEPISWAADMDLNAAALLVF